MKKFLLIIPLVFLLCFALSCQQGEEVAEEVPEGGIEEENKAAVRNWFEEGWNNHNPDIIEKYFAEDFYNYSMDVNRDQLKQFISNTLIALPDIQFTIEDQIAEGDQVATRWTLRATHKGEFMGVPATGKQFVASGMNISRHANGKYVEDWGNWDALGMLQQLGVTMTPPQPQKEKK
jgi:steroid delta-isomerase-like uncharacterized protein